MFDTLDGGLVSITCDRRGCIHVLIELASELRDRMAHLGWVLRPAEEFNPTTALCPACVLHYERMSTGDITA
ncbi:hypothetical protein [Geodermatophilus sp. DSM 45219]|uniref:hypothetical protein n=1 Tax=Geodermatophilus sp. DSM 45219 TaxID=1881103 RepID=UPI00087DF948|nr:hypothetical protein [Geodermatophilus sp. DSM 45219]SDN79452.1 hypothetical protein SAMN05428965_1656 [Geodermatophilus sp. DSM 45219]